MKKGDRVRISGKAGTVYGWVMELHELSKLPDVDHGPNFAAAGLTAAAKEALASLNVKHVALLSHRREGEYRRVIFAAIEADNRWWDLKGQELTIAPAPFEAAPTPPSRHRRRAEYTGYPD